MNTSSYLSPQVPYVLSVAGFDPSAGAGILADIKTFETIGVYGLGVSTAITFQNDKTFKNIDWLTSTAIIEQIAILQQQFQPSVAKIGLIENLEVLTTVISYLKQTQPEIKIIWDPILKASAGFTFHKAIDQKQLQDICSNCFLITPNEPEVKQLVGIENSNHAALQLNAYCSVLLKGGHSDDDWATDALFTSNKRIEFQQKRIPNGQKHGSGCVLSAAITAYLALGNSLEQSCQLAKDYITCYLSSTASLLGLHNTK
jgi:hydroxymethylpyrimidine/phosphomethylpyrimidine kinase